METNLPPLPEAHKEVAVAGYHDGTLRPALEDYYTADQMRDYAIAALAAPKAGRCDGNHAQVVPCADPNCWQGEDATRPLAAPKEAGGAQALELAAQFEWWLRFNAASHEHDGTAVHDDMHVTPPEWPRRGNLKKWIEILRRLAAPSKEAGHSDVPTLLAHAMKLAERWQACVDAPALRHTLTLIGLRLANPPGDQRQEGEWLRAKAAEPAFVKLSDHHVDWDEFGRRALKYFAASPPPEAAAAVGEDWKVKLLEMTLDGAKALGHHGTLRSSDDETVAYWERYVADGKAKLLAALASPTGVDEAMVERYVNAVDTHLGSLTTKQWEVERFDPAASIRRVARIGLTAALAARDGGAA